MPPPSDSSTQNTPLPPSVEKAYYRKCIELKRRLNEVEATNEEAKIRRVRLDRGILKMRLERAFLLDELRKRMEHNVDGSEASGDEDMATPPNDRPHRDKRRRIHPPPPPGPQPSASSHAHQPAPYAPQSLGRVPSQPENGRTGDNGAREPDARYDTLTPQQPAATRQQPPSAPPRGSRAPSQVSAHTPASPYGAAADARQMNGSNTNGAGEHNRDWEGAPTSSITGATGEALGAGSTIHDDLGSERKIVPTTIPEGSNVGAT